MDTAYVIGNGESRNIYPIETLKGNSIIYGCNAIYRDRPDLCDHIVAVNPPMYEELKKWHETTDTKVKIHGPEDISNWNYVCQGDNEDDVPEGLKLYRIWRGGDIKKNNANFILVTVGKNGIILSDNVEPNPLPNINSSTITFEATSQIRNLIYKRS